LSLAGNIVLMRLFVETRHALPARQPLAIALCSILTFAAGDRIIFVLQQSIQRLEE
jgi:hypothetical protein